MSSSIQFRTPWSRHRKRALTGQTFPSHGLLNETISVLMKGRLDTAQEGNVPTEVRCYSAGSEGGGRGTS